MGLVDVNTLTLSWIVVSGLKSAAVIGLVYLVIWVARLWPFYKRLLHYGNKFPGPKTIPIFGNALQVNGTPTEIFSHLADLMLQYKTNFRMWFGWQLFIFVNNPNDAQIILNGALSKASFYKLFMMAQKGSLLAPVPMWRKHRKLLNAAFNSKILETFMEIFTTQGVILTKNLSAKADGTEFDIYDSIIRCTLDSILETSLGTKLETEEMKKVYAVWPRIFNAGVSRLLNILLRSDYIFARTQTGIDFMEAKDLLNDVAERVIKKNKTLQTNKNLSDTFDIRKFRPIIDLLLEEDQLTACKEDKLSDDEVRDEALVVMIAGSDTTGAAMSSALVLLGMYEDIQDKVYSEISDIFGDSDRLPDLEDLKKMPYLKRVLKETIRLFPVNSIIPRFADEDIILSDKTIICRGAECIVSVWKLHRDPEVWPDPDRFDPDRFLPEEVKKRHPYSYIPFSAGPRSCAGFKYAWMSMLVFMSTILRQYKVSCDYKLEDIKMEMAFVISPENGYRLSLQHRT